MMIKKNGKAKEEAKLLIIGKQLSLVLIIGNV
jgi:hypothetical protein